MIGKILWVIESESGAKHTAIEWLKVRWPTISRLPGILGAVGDTVEITVQVIPKEKEETE